MRKMEVFVQKKFIKMAFSCGQLNPFRLEPWKFNKPTLDIYTYNSKCAQTEEKIPTLVSNIRRKKIPT